MLNRTEKKMREKKGKARPNTKRIQLVVKNTKPHKIRTISLHLYQNECNLKRKLGSFRFEGPIVCLVYETYCVIKSDITVVCT